MLNVIRSSLTPPPAACYTKGHIKSKKSKEHCRISQGKVTVEELEEVEISLHKIIHIDWFRFCGNVVRMDEERKENELYVKYVRENTCSRCTCANKSCLTRIFKQHQAEIDKKLRKERSVSVSFFKISIIPTFFFDAKWI